MGTSGARIAQGALATAIVGFFVGIAACVGDDASSASSNPTDGGGTSETGTPPSEGGSDAAVDGAAEAGVDAGVPGEIQWAAGFGSTETEQVFGLAVDAKGNVIIVGAYGSASVDVGCATPLTRNTNGGFLADDAFVVKLDPAGKCLWAKSFGGDLREQAYGVAVEDATDAIYVVGSTNSNPIAIGGTNVATSGDYDGFIVKLDAAGNTVSAKAYGGTGSDSFGGVVITATGQVVTTGTRTKPAGAGGMTFGSVALEAVDNANPQSYAFAAAFTTALNPVWARTIRGFNALGGTAGMQITADMLGNVIVAGTVSGHLVPARYPGNSGTVGNGDGSSDSFIVKIDGAGTQQTSWAKVFGGPDDEEPASVAVDGTGNVYFTAPYSTATSFGGAALAAPGSSEIVFAKFQPGGAHVFSKSFSTAEQDFPGGVAANAAGGHVVVGSQRAPFDFGNGPTTINGQHDAFVVAFDADGKARWTRTFGGAADDYARLVALRGSTVVVAGRYESNISIGGKTIAFSGGADIYVVKLTY